MIRHGKLNIYLDDIMVTTEKLGEHLRILGSEFDRLDKCEFMQISVKYLVY